MPALVRLYIRHTLIGVLIAIAFVVNVSLSFLRKK